MQKLSEQMEIEHETWDTLEPGLLYLNPSHGLDGNPTPGLICNGDVNIRIKFN